jgi:hypothetical protein
MQPEEPGHCAPHYLQSPMANGGGISAEGAAGYNLSTLLDRAGQASALVMRDLHAALLKVCAPGLFRCLRKLQGMPGRLPGTFRFWPFSCPEVSLPWVENFRSWLEGRPEASNRAKEVYRPRGIAASACHCLLLPAGFPISVSRLPAL